MCFDEDDTDIKLSDFGLSKIIAPNEKSDEPFGTIQYAAPAVLLGKIMINQQICGAEEQLLIYLYQALYPLMVITKDLKLENAINEEPHYQSPWVAKASKEGKRSSKFFFKRKMQRG